MRLESEDFLDQPAEIVYPLVRDEMDKILPFLPDIEKIVTIDYNRLDEDTVKVVNHWYGKADIPGFAKKFVKPELMSWKDFATWHDSRFCVDYHLESFLGNDIFDASGTNYFEPAGEGRTRIYVSATIDIYPGKVPGIPRLLAGRVKPMVEGLIRGMLEPNLTSLAKGLQGYFDSLK